MFSVEQISMFVKYLQSALSYTRDFETKEKSFIIFNYGSCALKKDAEKW